MVDTALSAAPATPERILHDVRAVLDISELDMSGAGPWLVLRTEPDPGSGSLTVPGTVVDGDTGRLVGPSGGQARLDAPGMVVYQGAYQTLTLLSGRMPVLSGRYSWREPQQGVVRGVPRECVYHPFAQPGVVLCRYDPTGGGNPFRQVCLLPEGWVSYVESAALAPQQPSPEVVRTWLADGNPLLFSRAVGASARSGVLDATLLRSLLDRTAGYPRAVLYFIALREVGQVHSDVLRAGLDADMAEGNQPDRRRSAALGLVAAKLFAPGAVVDALGEWTPRNRPGGLLDESLVAGDDYVGAAFALLVPA